MNVAAIWVGHVRTFHRIWPENTVDGCWKPLGFSFPIRNFFYTYPAGQCRRNRPNDPPGDYSPDEALEFVRLALRPEHLEIRGNSDRAQRLYEMICKRRGDMNSGHIGTLVYQYVRRLEAWEDFKRRVPEWQQLDAIAFHRPDIEFAGTPMKIATPIAKGCFYTFHALGSAGGIDDRFAIGHPLGIEAYMTAADSLEHLLIECKRSWDPELNYAKHIERTTSKRVAIKYTDVDQTLNHYVNIARFVPTDGRTLKEKLEKARKELLAPGITMIPNAKKKIAVIWTGHMRTAYRTVDAFVKQVVDPNSEKFEFDHFAHFYDRLTSGNSKNPSFADKIKLEPYVEAFRKRLRIDDPKRCVMMGVHPDDQVIVDRVANCSGRPGNFNGTTHQFLKRGRAWKDIFEVNDDIARAYSAFMFVRADIGYVTPMIFPPDWDPDSPKAEALLSWKDPRINGAAEDDRWYVIPKRSRDFLRDVGQWTTDFRQQRTDHIMPEEALWAAFERANLRKLYVHGKDPLFVNRFGKDDTGSYEAFIKDPTPSPIKPVVAAPVAIVPVVEKVASKPDEVEKKKGNLIVISPRREDLEALEKSTAGTVIYANAFDARLMSFIDSSSVVRYIDMPAEAVSLAKYLGADVRSIQDPARGKRITTNGLERYVFVVDENLPSQEWVDKHIIKRKLAYSKIYICSHFKNEAIANSLKELSPDIEVVSFESSPDFVDQSWKKTFEKDMTSGRYKLSAKMAPKGGFDSGLRVGTSFHIASNIMKQLPDDVEAAVLWSVFNPIGHETVWDNLTDDNTIVSSRWAGRNGITPAVVMGKCKTLRAVIDPSQWVDAARENIEIAVQTLFAECIARKAKKLMMSRTLRWSDRTGNELKIIPTSFWKTKRELVIQDF